MRGTFLEIGTESWVGLRRGSRLSLVCSLASPIPGLVSQPVVGFSLENKGFSEKEKKVTIFLARGGQRGSLVPLPRATN